MPNTRSKNLQLEEGFTPFNNGLIAFILYVVAFAIVLSTPANGVVTYLIFYYVAVKVYLIILIRSFWLWSENLNKDAERLMGVNTGLSIGALITTVIMIIKAEITTTGVTFIIGPPADSSDHYILLIVLSALLAAAAITASIIMLSFFKENS
ncbi:MAG: hypothetical protein ACPGO5_04670 [Patescibacteria group bacterium]